MTDIHLCRTRSSGNRADSPETRLRCTGCPGTRHRDHRGPVRAVRRAPGGGPADRGAAGRAGTVWGSTWRWRASRCWSRPPAGPAARPAARRARKSPP